ncbi:MAG TPA: hypothetical protein VND93_12920, partial [Myxococcales bacterium]|nr:hypothetical protein [Myxococcales bacterium]
AIDPRRRQTLYAGTGDPDPAAGWLGDALGVFRSTDSGATWAPIGVSTACAPGAQNGAMARATVGRLVVVPGTGLFAATGSGVFLYPESGSDCWAQVSGSLPSGVRATDLVFDAAGGKLYAAFWGVGVFQSTGATGASWTPLPPLTPPSAACPAAGATFGRVSIAVAPSQPGTLYAGIDGSPSGNGAGPFRLVRYTTGPGSVQTLEMPCPLADQDGLYAHLTLAVHPARPAEVYAGLIDFWRSLDGGRTATGWNKLGCCASDANPFRSGVDVHADVHAIAFAPYGTYTESSSSTQILYVATDGGLFKGVVDELGAVTWQNLSGGLAVGQIGTMGQSPADPTEVAVGLWHNGTQVLLAGAPPGIGIGGGDGFQVKFDAMPGPIATLYFNGNAGYGGDISRTTWNRFLRNLVGPWALIWRARGATSHWTDPFRPGDLVRLENGRLYRVQGATYAPASSLLQASAWTDITPPTAGMAKVIAFQSGGAGAPSVYYVGTDQGEVFRGAPGAWTDICAGCGGNVAGIGVDATQADRIVVVRNGAGTASAVAELLRQSGGGFTVNSISGSFSPPLSVRSFNDVAIDPLIPAQVFVATDQGMYRGRKGSSGWTWTRSPGIPDVVVMSVESQVGPGGASGIIRAATYGRGLYQLQRSRVNPAPVPASLFSQASFKLRINAAHDDGTGFPFEVTVQIGEAAPQVQKTPAAIDVPAGARVRVTAPTTTTDPDGQALAFAGWTLNRTAPDGPPEVSFVLSEDSAMVARYDRPDRIAIPIRLTALQTGLDGAPRPLTASVRVGIGDGPLVGYEMPLTVRAPREASITVEAWKNAPASGHLLRFVGWAIQPGHGQPSRRTTFFANAPTSAVAYFVDEQESEAHREHGPADGHHGAPPHEPSPGPPDHGPPPHHGEPAHPPDPHPPH